MNQNTNLIVSPIVIGLLLLSSSAAAQICNYVPLEPHASKVNIENLSIDFGQGDDANKPQAWQGPLTITQSGNTSSCSVDPNVSILERPFYQDGQRLLVTTYSGSNKVVFAIDTTNCKVLWQSKPFEGNVSVKANLLHLGKQRIKLNTNCIPKQ